MDAEIPDDWANLGAVFAHRRRWAIQDDAQTTAGVNAVELLDKLVAQIESAYGPLIRHRDWDAAIAGVADDILLLRLPLVVQVFSLFGPQVLLALLLALGEMGEKVAALEQKCADLPDAETRLGRDS